MKLQSGCYWRWLQQGRWSHPTAPGLPLPSWSKRRMASGGSVWTIVNWMMRPARTPTLCPALTMPWTKSQGYSGSAYLTYGATTGRWSWHQKQEDPRRPSPSAKFHVMPVSLCNSPTTFERLMERVLVVYLHHLLVHATDFELTLESHSRGGPAPTPQEMQPPSVRDQVLGPCGGSRGCGHQSCQGGGGREMASPLKRQRGAQLPRARLLLPTFRPWLHLHRQPPTPSHRQGERVQVGRQLCSCLCPALHHHTHPGPSWCWAPFHCGHWHQQRGSGSSPVTGGSQGREWWPTTAMSWPIKCNYRVVIAIIEW